MKWKSIIYYCLVFLSTCLIANFFPFTNLEIEWSLKNIVDIHSLISIRNFSLITSSLTTLFINYKILKILAMGTIYTCLIAIMKNMVDKKNDIIILISCFLFLLLDRTTFARSFIQIEGFTGNIIGILLILTFIKLYIKNTLTKMNPLVLIVLGLILSNLEVPYAFTAFLITLIYIFYREDKEEYKSLALLIGELIGLVYNIFRLKLSYTGFTHNLLHEFIPTMCGLNFVIVLLLSLVTMVGAIKIFSKGKFWQPILCILGMSSFLFSSLLFTNDYLNYITFVLFNVSTIYILLDISKSRQFKRRIGIYYLFKITYIFMLSIFGCIDEGSTLFPFIIDMVLILELYNLFLPDEFFSPLWIGVFLIFSSVNIYIYKNVYEKYDEMNIYIKNKLECTTDDISLPSKFELDYLVDYIPVDREEKESYIKFYEIDVYDKDRTIEIDFRKNIK